METGREIGFNFLVRVAGSAVEKLVILMVDSTRFYVENFVEAVVKAGRPK